MESAGNEADGALTRLREARAAAEAGHAAAADAARENAAMIRHLDAVAARFTLRRDHLQAAAESDPANSRPAAELASTAERLRQGVDRVRRGVVATGEEATEQMVKAAAALDRIDASMTRLNDAMKSLELIRLEQASRERVSKIEQAGFDRLARLGNSAAFQPPARRDSGLEVDLEFHVREVIRLAYEAEALADLQRERLG